ncbi:MAG: TonB-dependent receptor [Bacteroidota bacterium]
MKNIVTIVLLLACSITWAQSTISGTVTNAKGEALEYAQVYLAGTTKGTTTDKSGNYQITKVPNGIYTIEIIYIGYSEFSSDVTISGVDVTVDAQLNSRTEQLQEVEIIGRKTTDYRPDVTFAGTRTGAKIKDVPQAISILNKEIIKDQALFRLNEVTENIAGVTQTRTGDNFTSRGFRISHDFINGNRALVAPQFASSTIATQYERIEFIKGPAAALFGNSSPGGVINAVTKKPLDINRASATYTYGSFDTKRATADITGPLTQDKKLLYRLNLSHENSENFRDFIKNRSLLFAPSISYLPTDKTRINVDIVGTINNDDAGVDRGMPVLQEDLFALPISFSTAEPYDNRQNNQVFFTVSGTHEFSDNLSLNVSYTRSEFDQNFLETRSSNQFNSDGTELIRTIIDRQTNGGSEFVTAYLVGKFSTGSVRHEAVLGWDYYDVFQDTFSRTAQGETNGVPNLRFNNRRLFFTLTELPNLNFNNLVQPSVTEERYRGLYLQDLITTGKFKFLLGLRYENLDQVNVIGTGGTQPDGLIDNDVFLPRFGVTYELNENFNLFGSYTQAFSPQTLPFGLTPDGATTFDPLESNQFEIGTKATFFQERLLAQLSLYTINRTGRIIEDPLAGGGIPQFIQIDDEVSRGLEFEVQGRINSNFTLTANYAFNEIDVEQDIDAQGLELENNNPQHTAGFWGKYTITQGVFKNLGLGLGGRYVSSSRVPSSVPNAIRPIIEFPDYFTARAGIYYRYSNFDVSANFNNIFDERYFIGGLNAGRVFPGAPRNFLLSVGYSF